MSYASHDLAPLFAAPPAAAVGYKQGTIRAWNPTTAENTVEVNGVMIDNLSVLNTNEVLLLAPGDVVAILTWGGSWTILGRLTMPGTPAAASALAAIGTVTGEALSQASTTSNDWTDLAGGPEVTVDVRPSGRVLLLFSAQIGWSILAAGAAGGQAGVDVSGANTMALTGPTNSDRQIRAYSESGGATTNVGIFGVGSQKMLTGLNPGPTTFKLRYRAFFGKQVDFDNRAITAILL